MCVYGWVGVRSKDYTKCQCCTVLSADALNMPHVNVLNKIVQFLTYSLKLTLLGSKHLEVIKEDIVFSDLPVTVISARAGVYINIFIMQVHGCESYLTLH